MVCKVGMSLYCIQILHAKLGSFEKQKKLWFRDFLGWFFWFCFFLFLSWHLRRLKVGTLLSQTHTHAPTHAPTQLHAKEGEWEHFLRLTELDKKSCFLLLKKRVNKKDYLNISHLKKKKKKMFI